jgi:putative copper export protein
MWLQATLYYVAHRLQTHVYSGLAWATFLITYLQNTLSSNLTVFLLFKHSSMYFLSGMASLHCYQPLASCDYETISGTTGVYSLSQVAVKNV